MKHYLLIFLGVLMLLSGCESISEREHIQRLDLFFYEYPNMTDNERAIMVDSLGQGIDALFFITGDSISEDGFMKYAESKAVKMFTPDVIERLTSLDSVERVLWQVNVNFREKLPDVALKNIYGIISPYNQSVFTVDSVTLVGLNHYLGSDYRGYSNFDSYRRQLKELKYMPYDIVETLVVSDYGYKPMTDATVLNRMLYEGALIYVKMQIVPNGNLADALGYTKEQLDWVERNSREMWNALVTRKLLYSTSLSDADKLMLPSPATTVIHPESPGRVGRYIGYKIVSAYIEKFPDVSLAELLSPEFYNSPMILIKSRYNGE